MELPKIIAFKLTSINKGTSVKYEIIDVIPKEDLKNIYDEIKNSNVFEEEEHFKAYVLRTLEDIL